MSGSTKQNGACVFTRTVLNIGKAGKVPEIR